MAREIVVRGQPVACDANVRTWSDTGIGFVTRPRRTQTRGIVLHWTGGEAGGRGVYQTLVERGLSVNFCVDQDGSVWQYCDADRMTAHAGGVDAVLSANPWAVGIEIVNRGSPLQPDHGVHREQTLDTIHGKLVHVTSFLPEQIAAALALCEALCKAFGLPMDVPRDHDGMLECGLMNRVELASFRGVLGHYHNNPMKTDPGNEILRAVAARGGRPA